MGDKGIKNVLIVVCIILILVGTGYLISLEIKGFNNKHTSKSGNNVTDKNVNNQVTDPVDDEDKDINANKKIEKTIVLNGTKHTVVFEKTVSDEIFLDDELTAYLTITVDGKTVNGNAYAKSSAYEVSNALASLKLSSIKDTKTSKEYLVLVYNILGLPIMNIIGDNGNLLLNQEIGEYTINSLIITAEVYTEGTEGTVVVNKTYSVTDGKLVTK